MTNIRFLCEEYETLCVNEKPTATVVKAIYKELLEIGLLPSEIQNKQLVKEIIGSAYDHYVDIYMEFLFNELQFTAVLDTSLGEQLIHNLEANESQSDSLEHEEKTYLITCKIIDLGEDGKSEESIVPYTFDSLETITEFVQDLKRASDILHDGQESVEVTELLATEDATDELIKTYGIFGEVLADQIEPEVTATASIIYMDINTELVKYAEIYCIHEATKY